MHTSPIDASELPELLGPVGNKTALLNQVMYSQINLKEPSGQLLGHIPSLLQSLQQAKQKSVEICWRHITHPVSDDLHKRGSYKKGLKAFNLTSLLLACNSSARLLFERKLCMHWFLQHIKGLDAGVLDWYHARAETEVSCSAIHGIAKI